MPNTNSIIQFKYGLQAKFDAIAAKDANTVYFTTDEQRMFVGDVEYTRPVGHGDTLPTGYNPPNSLFIKELTGGGRELYYSKDGAGWEKISSLPAAITADTVGTNASTTPVHGGNITIPKITYDAHGAISSASDQTIKLPTETDVSVTAGTAPANATALTHGGEFTVVSDVKKGSGSHTVVESLAKFKLPSETAISVDSPAATAGGALTHGGSITVVTGVAKGDSSHNIDVTTKTFTLPTAPVGSGEWGSTTDKTKYVSYTKLNDHKLEATVQDADTDVKTGTGIPTTAAVKSYVDGIVGANDAMVYKGVLAATAAGIYTPAANCGDTYKVSTAGKINGHNVEVGDMLICTKDGTVAATSSNTATVDANWNIIQANIEGAIVKDSAGSFTTGQVVIASGPNSIKTSGFTLGMSVPAGSKLTDTKYKLSGALQSDGTFKATLAEGTGSADATIPLMTPATASAAGKSGLVPAPGAAKNTSFLRGDGTWVVPTDTKYGITGALQSDGTYKGTLTANGTNAGFTIPIMGAATADAAGTTGLVPAPGENKQTAFLRGDGTWVVPTNTTYAADRGISLVSGKFGHSNATVTANTSGLNTAKTLAWGKSITLNTIKYDAYGHISGTGTYTITMPANPNVDTKVNNIARGTTKAYLLATTTAPTASAVGTTAVSETDVYLSDAGTLHATTFDGALKGNADSATNATKLGGVAASSYALKTDITNAALKWGSF